MLLIYDRDIKLADPHLRDPEINLDINHRTSPFDLNDWFAFNKPDILVEYTHIGGGDALCFFETLNVVGMEHGGKLDRTVSINFQLTTQ